MPEYIDHRRQIRSGDLIAFSNKKIKSLTDVLLQIIRIFTKSEYDHVGVAWEIGGRLMIVEAVIPEVRIFPLSKRGPFYHLPMDIAWDPNYDNQLLAYVGDPYSITEAIQSYFGKPAKDDRWQCAELVRDFYTRVGIKLPEEYTPAAVVQNALEYSGNGIEYVK